MAASKDFISISGKDWLASRVILDPWLTRLITRLDAQEGRSGTPKFYSAIDMQANRILNGPSPQTNPEPAEFITRAYADAKYTAGPAVPVTPTSFTVIVGQEVTTPSNPAANGFKLYAKDNGAGKTQLCVLFHTGSEHVLATEV